MYIALIYCIYMHTYVRMYIYYRPIPAVTNRVFRPSHTPVSNAQTGSNPRPRVSDCSAFRYTPYLNRSAQRIDARSIHRLNCIWFGQ